MVPKFMLTRDESLFGCSIALFSAFEQYLRVHPTDLSDALDAFEASIITKSTIVVEYLPEETL